MPPLTLQDGYLAVMQADTSATLRNELVRFAESLGFLTVSALTIVDHPAKETEFHSIGNAPLEYLQSYNDMDQGRQDPVMQYCKHAAVPLIWDQETYVSSGQGEMWEHQAKFGYRTGVALAIHLPNGRHFTLGVERDQPLPANARAMTRIVADLQLFAVHAQDAAFRIFSPPVVAPELPALTPRELEALRWTMEGKTAWEVGNIMSISERTAVLHIQNAMHKLDCVNKHQAVLKALRAGLLT